MLIIEKTNIPVLLYYSDIRIIAVVNIFIQVDIVVVLKDLKLKRCFGGMNK
jgi:hypothetical protein